MEKKTGKKVDDKLKDLEKESRETDKEIKGQIDELQEESRSKDEELSSNIDELQEESRSKDEELEAEIERLKEENKKSTFSRVMNIVLWVVLLIWMSICLVDFYNVHAENDPVFCLKKETHKYDDGNVYMCTGLGYKVINYKRDSFKAIEFGPFWSKDRTEKSEENKD